MSKTYGSRHMLSPHTQEAAKRKAEYTTAMQTGKYDQDKSYYSDSAGGYVLTGKGRKTSKEEMEAAIHLANSGYIVELTSEGGGMNITAKYQKNGKEQTRYSEGKIFGVVYEQRTTNDKVQNIVNNVKNAIEHAKDKQAHIALLYDKAGKYHRKDIDDGIAKYNEHNDKSKYQSIDLVIVIDKNGRVYEHTLT